MVKKSAVALVCLIFCLTFALAAQAARVSGAADDPPPPTANTKVTIDFRDVDVRVVAKFISDLTGKNFVFDKQVQEKVTVFSPTKVTPDEAYRLFESVLKIHGYTTIPKGNLVRIVPSVKARTMDVELRQRLPKAEEAEDRVVTQLVRLQYASATEVRNLLQPIVDKTGVVMAYEEGNTLIVTDYASNIDRLLQIIRAVDIPEKGTQLTVIGLTFASARELARELEEVLRGPRAAAPARPQQPAAAGVGYTVVPDERTNSLIVMAQASETKLIRDLVKKLDVATTRGTERVHVYFLQNAVAADLAKTLNDLTGQFRKEEKDKAKGPTKLVLQEDVFITSDKATNSLIVRAERHDYLVIKDLIDKLDIQRAQVLVEGVIMETTVNKANALGAEWRLLNFPSGSDSSLIGFGGTNLPTSGSQGLINQVATQPFASSGLILGAAEGTITFGGTTFLNIAALIHALQQDSDVDILSTPHLLTMDNEEARIMVGQERPFLRTSLATDTGAVSPSITKTYEFKDLGLVLTITPHITQGEYVTLKIFQQLKSFLSEVETGAISSTKRETETTVRVKNGETIVIGGLISDELREEKSQVPCLGDIPILGWVAKARSQSGQKVSLLILIKPTIIRTAEQLRELTDQKKRERKESDAPGRDRSKTFPAKGLDLLKK
ncbi:MAG: type II secretion system secretin GspD [Pseudomonadota bacterium]